MSDIIPIVLCGGLGTRLQSTVPGIPKALAPVQGRPFLDYILTELVKNQWSSACLATGYGANMIKDYYGDNFEGMRLVYSKEDTPLGTGGAVLLAHTQLKAEQYFILNGDSIIKFKHSDMIDFYHSKKALLVIASVEVTTPERYGTILFESETMKVISFKEKLPDSCGSASINAGCYVLAASLLEHYSFSQSFSLETDLFRNYSSGAYIYRVPTSDFIDIGTADSYSLSQLSSWIK